MPPKGHALLSASSSDRWLHCPPSARLCEAYEDKGSDYAAEGTDAHALCEYKLRKVLGMKATDPTKSLNWYNAEMEDSEIEVVLSRVDELVSWANDIKEYALQQAISGKEWTVWKLVEGRSNRRYTNEDAVSKTVEAAGFDPYEKKLLGITAMQKLLGKSRFEELLADYVEKPQGKPTLVPESDKRPAMNTAKNDFKEEYDNE